MEVTPMAERPVSPEPTSEVTRGAGAVPRSLTFAVERNITSKNIQALLEKVYTMAGCRTCGLLGFDIRFHVVDPAIRTQFQGIDGLADVSEDATLHA
jgi:hypothetical protein